MTDLEAYILENKYPVRAIESEARGLKYLVDDDRKGLMIAGKVGMTGLTLRQVEALCMELPGVLEGMMQ